MKESHKQKVINMIARGHKPSEIAEIFRVPEADVLALVEKPKKAEAPVKKVVQAPKVEEQVKPVQTTTQTQGYNATTGLHTKTTTAKKVGWGKK